ncbi:MAG: hypothetical protein IPQ08_00010 [Chitinophagaceae bacterium]|nr:hypothetical protein [Chitinophagaceae bacterium]
MDIAFLILSFFMTWRDQIQVTGPSVEITTPGSVLSQALPESNAVLISIDSPIKYTMLYCLEKEPEKFDDVINGVNSTQNLGLTTTEIRNFRKTQWSVFHLPD